MGERGTLVGAPSRGGLFAARPERTERSRVFQEDRFLTRARALFYARLAFLVLGLGVIGVPSWSAAFGIRGSKPFAVYLLMVAYSAANYLFLARKKLGKALTFATLCADLCVLVWLVSVTGGLRSPLLAAQLLFTIQFVLLFPTPLAVVPPLLAFPVVAKASQVLGGHALTQIDVFILLWYSAINCILVYVIVYLNERDRTKHRELQKLSTALRDMAIVDERNRLAREIHDGLGGVLSSVVIQSDYLLNMIDGSEVRARLSGNTEARAVILPTIRKELSDLHDAASESMDELRRSLRMMKEDFDLVGTVSDYCRLASGRHRLDVRFERTGPERSVGPESALALFRVLQEAVTNAAKHCPKGTVVEVSLAFDEQRAKLTIHDRGPGFTLPSDPATLSRAGHYGLANMRERAKKVSGDFRMTSAPGKGTCIELGVHAGEELER
ncbi:MAG: sensor histidine kinase [Deltaproteobacteria bacterium]|nr:MAG: sensor histidine kinase [Deltaproteobacteria bacterium]